MHSAVTDFPWSRYRRLIDMGGAYGSFLAALLRRCPRSEGVLFDQPQARARRASFRVHYTLAIGTGLDFTSRRRKPAVPRLRPSSMHPRM